MSERTPLLGSGENGGVRSCPQTPEHAPASASSNLSWERARSHWKKWKPIYLCTLLILVLDIPGDIVAAPALSLIERGVCRDIYGDDINDHLCGNTLVQTRVAKARSIMSTLALIPSMTPSMLQTPHAKSSYPGLLLSVPYGMLADRKGRKLVIALVIVGALGYYSWFFMVLYFYNTFPFWVIYFGSGFLWLGGGGFVIAAVISAVIADVVSSEFR